jgi:DNA-binding transcriptional LysR family regulator
MGKDDQGARHPHAVARKNRNTAPLMGSSKYPARAAPRHRTRRRWRRSLTIRPRTRRAPRAPSRGLRLRGAFPELALRITSGWSPRLAEQVARSELDAAALCLADGVRPPDDLLSEDLGTQAVLLIAAPALNVPKPVPLAELARYPWVMNESGCGFRAFIRHKFEASRLPFHVAVEAISADLRMSLVARGLGIGIVTPAAFGASPWREVVEVIDAPDFRRQVR